MEKKTWITGRFVFYIFLLIFGLIFTQALRSSSSAVLFIFLLMLPILSLIIVLVGRATVKVYVDVDNTRVEKDTDVGYSIRITNDSFIPFPFIEAHLSVPEDNGVRCVEQRMMIPLVPFGVREIKQTVRFHYRGKYEIGVLDMRIKDPLGLFSASLDQSICHTIIVYPRMMEMTSPHENSTTESPTDLTRRAITSERSEQANIRNYVGGDSLKDIHWKLSAKMEDLLVRDYNTNNNRHTFIIADLNAPRAEKDPADEPKKLTRKEKKAAKKAEKAEKAVKRNVKASAEKRVIIEGANGKELSAKRKQFAEEIVRAVEAEELAAQPKKKFQSPELRAEMLGEIAEKNCDRVIELAISATMRELRAGGTVTLIYNDSREGSGVSARYYPDTTAFASEILNFATAPVTYDERGVASLFTAIDETQSLTVRLVSANVTPADVSDYIGLAAACGGGGSDTTVELYLADSPEAYSDPVARGDYVAAMREELASCAVKMSRFEETVMPDGSAAFAKEED